MGPLPETRECTHHVFIFGLPNPIFSIREIVVLYMGESEIPYLRSVASLRTLVTFVTWLISRTEFSSSELVL